MSYMKAYLEDIASSVATADHIENADPYQYTPFEYPNPYTDDSDDVELCVLAALTDGKADLVFEHLASCWTECHVGRELAEKPLTFKAMVMLLPFVSDELLAECEYTRNPLSLVMWDEVADHS